MAVKSPYACFVTGTDTGVGKSRVAAALLHGARLAGLSTAGMKPVASGCEETPHGLRNDDALALQQETTVTLSYEQINPVSLRAAVAPHVAAARDGRRVTVQRLEGLCRAVLMKRADLTVIEGAGGWRVPLNDRELYPDLVQSLNLPVILVVGVRLGCINHAVLTAEAVLADGLPLAGWVANHIDAGMPEAEANVATLRALLPAPCLGVLPWSPRATPGDTAAGLDLGALLPYLR